jgi:hypothetical protein
MPFKLPSFVLFVPSLSWQRVVCFEIKQLHNETKRNETETETETERFWPIVDCSDSYLVQHRGWVARHTVPGSAAGTRLRDGRPFHRRYMRNNTQNISTPASSVLSLIPHVCPELVLTSNPHAV